MIAPKNRRRRGSSEMEAPQPNDRILLLRQPWLELILAGQKTLEIRGRALSPGKYWLGHQKMIHGFVMLGEATRIHSDGAWRNLAHKHRVDLPRLPYKKTYGLPVLRAQVTRRVPYVHPKGAVVVVRYRRG